MKLTDDVKQRKQKHFKQYRTAKQKLTNKENLVRFLHRGKPTSLKWPRIEASYEGKSSYQVFHMHGLTVFIDTIISIKFHCNPPFCRCRNNCNFPFESTIGRCSGDHSKRPRNSEKDIWRPPSHVAGVPTPSSSFEFCGDWK